jgi:hypothetical protein
MQEVGSEYGMDSMISVSSLRDMQDGNIPKRSRRRNNNSRGNTVSLDISSRVEEPMRPMKSYRIIILYDPHQILQKIDSLFS